MKLSYPAFKYLDKGSTDEIVRNHAEFIKENLNDLCASIQHTIVEMLINKIEKASDLYNIYDNRHSCHENVDHSLQHLVQLMD